MRISVFRAGALAFAFLTLAAASAGAQAPLPGTGFVPPFEIMRTVRTAGFDPLAPPLREGTTYVLRATDFRGILMRVVVDAHSGAIRDVNRIVPGPGSSDQLGMVSPSRYGPPRYGAPVYEEPTMMPAEAEPSWSRLPPARTPTRPAVSTPLPRPRPASLASRSRTSSAKPEGKSDARGSARLDGQTNLKSDAATMPAAPVAPAKAAPPAPLND